MPTLVVGTGPAAVQVANEIAARPDSGIRLLGFLGENRGKTGLIIHGLPVVSSVADLQAGVSKVGARQILIPDAESSGRLISQIMSACETCGVAVKIIPSINGAESGRVNLPRLRDVSVEDLLYREPVRLPGEGARKFVEGRRVLVTGAGGSIGSELCRIVCRYNPASLLAVEQAENSLFHLHWKLAEEFPEIHLHPFIADICDAGRVKQIFSQSRPEVIFHAAAHKHVPLMESNPGEAIKNNVVGTRLLADLSAAYGVGEFVMISTDKAVNPTSVMGVSKRVAELYVQALSQRSRTRFGVVRFGNVLGSAGSVVPLFRDQIRRGGPVTVTHPDMRRYFMTIPEACELVLEAAAMGRGGEIFILDMGEPVLIVQLANDLIRLAGLVPGQDIEVRFTGIRPGEKLFEELALKEENAARTRHPRIFIGRMTGLPWEQMDRHVEELAAAAAFGDVDLIHARFRAIVPEYASPRKGRKAPEAAEAADNGTNGDSVTFDLPLAPLARPV
jgi:FlaA1/EpsC-like NDP-sugar epimerase